MPKTSKLISSSVLIVDNQCGEIFIVDGNASNTSSHQNKSILSENLYTDETEQDIEDENDLETIEEYLDECFEENEDLIESPATVEIIEEIPDVKKGQRKEKHKLRQLTGKPACKYCDKIFLTKESRSQHECEYLKCNPGNFICRICNKELSRKTFSNHLHETLDCQYCQKSFINPRNLKTHIKKSHSNEEYIPSSSRLRLDDEKNDSDEIVDINKPKSVKKKERIECETCGRLFSSHKSLQSHIDIHMNNYKYVCDVCGEKYATSSGILKHACMSKKRKRPEVDYRLYDVRHCKYCGQSFPTLEDNNRHNCEFQFVDDEKSFQCRFCELVMSKNSYNKHMARHLATDDDLTCEFCGKKLADKTSLAIHITIHTGDKPFKCTFEGCEQSFINKNLLQRHSRFHGAKIPTYSCSICSKEVASKYHLKFHMKTHKSNVECQLCKKEFPTRDKLREHYANDHTPFKCQFCDKTFALQRYVRMHESTHTQNNDKPFKCDFCTKNFTKVALLMNHVLKVHSENFESWKKDREELFATKTLIV